MKKFHYADSEKMVYSEGNTVYIDTKGDKTAIRIKNVLTDWFTLFKRALRKGIHNVMLCHENIIVVVNRKILFYKANELKYEMNIARGKRPLRQGMECINGKLFYGDYWMNPQRVPSHLYCVDLSNYKQEVFISFDYIQHIHFVQKDILLPNSLLIGTGDKDSECGLYQLDINTKKLITIAEGSQKVRAVSMLQYGVHLIWGSDAPDEDNYIYHFNRDTNKMNQLHKIEGPAYYSTMDANAYMYIATTVEYRDKHQAVIYRSCDNGLNWSEFKRFKKDIWDTHYFGYGIVEFLKGQEYHDKLFYNAVGLNEIRKS